MLQEQIRCKECGEHEMVQIGTEQAAESLCYDCYENESQKCSECEEGQIEELDTDLCNECLAKQMKEWEEEQKAQYRDWCRSRF